MHRRPLLELLDQYKHQSPREQQCLMQIKQFVRTHSDCFQRECQVGHITASAWIVHPHEKKVLLMLHRKLGKWLQLGGHADGDHDVLAVALREAHEESGLQDIEPVDNRIFDIDVHSIPAIGGVPEHIHYDIRFLLRAKTADIQQNEAESIDLRWFTIHELNAMEIDESVGRMQHKYMDY